MISDLGDEEKKRKERKEKMPRQACNNIYRNIFHFTRSSVLVSGYIHCSTTFVVLFLSYVIYHSLIVALALFLFILSFIFSFSPTRIQGFLLLTIYDLWDISIPWIFHLFYDYIYSFSLIQ